jgi:hypothetical protein
MRFEMSPPSEVVHWLTYEGLHRYRRRAFRAILEMVKAHGLEDVVAEWAMKLGLEWCRYLAKHDFVAEDRFRWAVKAQRWEAMIERDNARSRSRLH